MYLQGYDEGPQLNGWFSKTFKKIFKPALHVGAAIFTGGASIPMSANMLAQQKAAKEAQRMADEQAKREMAVIVANEKLATGQVSLAKLLPARKPATPTWVVPTVIAAASVAAVAVIVSTSNRR